jgi:hypothetical protein
MPLDDRSFLAWVEGEVEQGQKVSQGDVDRLRRLAEWADTPAPPNWDGTLDRMEAMRAIKDARKRLPLIQCQFADTNKEGNR